MNEVQHSNPIGGGKITLSSIEKNVIKNESQNSYNNTGKTYNYESDNNKKNYKLCPFCKSEINKKATCCPKCGHFITHPILTKALIHMRGVIGRSFILFTIASIVMLIILPKKILNFMSNYMVSLPIQGNQLNLDASSINSLLNGNINLEGNQELEGLLGTSLEGLNSILGAYQELGL